MALACFLSPWNETLKSKTSFMLGSGGGKGFYSQKKFKNRLSITIGRNKKY